jgi:carbon storage regulator CsrA
MLVVSRKAGESLSIGSDTIITVISIGTEQVRFGIEAPPECKIACNDAQTCAKTTGEIPRASLTEEQKKA